jgi:response regulator RpfG family c-di-GMP phosphodiesterase
MAHAALEHDGSSTATPQPTLLLVDDEVNILSALRRLFRSQRYRVLTATSGREGLELLEREAVDMVISDMRMPNMDGAQFLSKVRERWPEAVRVLLTGYADLTSTIDAINNGEIYRYVAKPWEDNDVLLLVQHALERKALEREKQRLEALTVRQNEELRDLNANLESRVKERTEALRRALASLEAAHERLKSGFLTSIQVFASLVEMRAGTVAGHSRRVAEHARRLAQRMELPPAELQDVFLAALLHDLGKLGLPDNVLAKPASALTGDEREQVQRHPAKGETALMPLEQLRAAARLIRSHHERYDGLGYPDGLSGLNIPTGARILAVANEYDGLLEGTLTGKRTRPKDAVAALIESKGKRYDPQVVDAFVALLAEADVSGRFSDRAVPASRLADGMVLSRDVFARDGLLLIARDRTLDQHLIRQLQGFEAADGHPLTLYVKPTKE